LLHSRKLHPAPTFIVVVLLQKGKTQERNSITRTQKVVRPDNGPFSGEVTSFLGRIIRGKKKGRGDGRGEGPEMKIVPSVCRDCGSFFPLSGDGVLVIRERSKSTILVSVSLNLSREGSPIHGSDLTSILPGETAS
jgi:hypothetical protein